MPLLVKRLPMQIPLNEDALEYAYWCFDTERKHHGMERDAFKHEMRLFARQTARDILSEYIPASSQILQETPSEA